MKIPKPEPPPFALGAGGGHSSVPALQQSHAHREKSSEQRGEMQPCPASPQRKWEPPTLPRGEGDKGEAEMAISGQWWLFIRLFLCVGDHSQKASA